MCDRLSPDPWRQHRARHIRRERQGEARARRPKENPPKPPARQLAARAIPRPAPSAKARERLTERDRRRLSDLFERDPIIAEAWGLKEAFRNIYLAVDREQAAQRLDTFLAAVDRSGLSAFQAFAKGVRSWRAELPAYFDEPTTNGYAEGLINKAKVIKRRAYGLPTFSGFRARVLRACA